MSIDGLFSSERLPKFRAYGTAAGRSPKNARFLAFIGTILVAALILAAPNAEAQDAPVFTVVYPTGVFPVDRQNVQAAVNHGGVVLLKAVDTSGNPLAFNFGPPVNGSGGVFLNADVTVTGETVGGAMTTITGGNAPFRAVLPSQGVRSAFRQIYFNGPRIAAVLLFYSKGFDFRACKVTGVVGFPFLGYIKGQAIWLGPSGDPAAVTGTFAIEDNVIEGIQAPLGYGLALVTFSGQMSVARNTIRDTPTAGILLLDNAGAAVVEDNYVEPGPLRYPDAVAYGAGIQINTPQLGAVAYVRHNQVVCANPQAVGIILASVSEVTPVPYQNSVIEQNDVTMHGNLAFGGIALFDAVDNNFVGQNRILGDGPFALQVSTEVAGDNAVSNTFAGNNISGFQSTIADVFFDINSMNNVLVGNSGSVIDLGIGNQITGFTKGDGGAALGQLKDAQATMRDTLRWLSTYERNVSPFEP